MGLYFLRCWQVCQNFVRTKRTPVIIITTVVVILAALVTLFAIPTTRYSILGRFITKRLSFEVVDHVTNQPIMGATIKVGPYKVVTDLQGETTFKAVPVGSYRLVISQTGYETLAQSFTVGLFETTKLLLFHLQSVNALAGSPGSRGNNGNNSQNSGSKSGGQNNGSSNGNSNGGGNGSGSGGSGGGPAGKPSVPSWGSYLGAFVNPAGISGNNAEEKATQVPPFEQEIGRKLAVDHHYEAFHDSAFPDGAETADAQKGRITMVSWECGNDADVIAGTDDSIIKTFADEIKAYGQSLFLRYYWEMNLDTHPQCLGSLGPYGYIQAWQHIWNIFHTEGVTNAAWVWCPNIGAFSDGDDQRYYPGDKYVDWVCADGYSDTNSDFAKLVAPMYQRWGDSGKPLMLGEYGACPNLQTTWFDEIPGLLQNRYPNLKALVYFDAPGQKCGWQLGNNNDGNGLAAYAQMGGTAWFNPKF